MVAFRQRYPGFWLSVRQACRTERGDPYVQRAEGGELIRLRTSLAVCAVAVLAAVAVAFLLTRRQVARTAPDAGLVELPCGEPRLLLACPCLSDPIVRPCRCRCHTRVTDGDSAVRAFRDFVAVHKPWGEIQAFRVSVTALECGYRGKDCLFGYRVCARRPNDVGEQCRGIDFLHGTSAAVSVWETPARSRTQGFERFLRSVCDERLRRTFERYVVDASRPDYETLRSSGEGTPVPEHGDPGLPVARLGGVR